MWFRSLFAGPSSQFNRPYTRRTRQTAGHRGKARQLFLESLEDRRLMAFNVLHEYATGPIPQDVALAPIDAGGQLDLVTIENGRVVIRLGNANGSFGDPIVPAAEILAEHAITGDFTSDGVTDLVTSQGGQLHLRIGNGNGTFQEPASFGFLPPQMETSPYTGIGLYGQNAGSIATGDLNEDGKLDLAVGGSTLFPTSVGCGPYSCSYNYSTDDYINVLLGTGAGSFDYVDADPSDADLNAFRLGTDQWAVSLAIDDLDSDGQADVIAAKPYGLAALLGDGTGHLHDAVHSNGLTSLPSISLGDLDGDGNLDTMSQGGNSLVVEKGQADGSFIQGAAVDTGLRLQSAVIGDVNGDGKLDLVAVGTSRCSSYGLYGGCYDQTTPTKQVSVLLGDGRGSFSLPVASSLGPVNVSDYSMLNDAVLADLAGDSLPDLVTIDARYDGRAIVAVNDGTWAVPEELSISDATVVEGDSGSASAIFTVTLTGQTAGPVTVDFAVFDYYQVGSQTAAQAGVDYTGQYGTLTFGPGVLSQTITVPILGDRVGEGNEYFFVNLSHPAGALVRDGQAMGTVVDNEPGISIDHAYNVDPLTVVEGDSGTKPAVFTVSLSRPYDQEVTVHYHTVTGNINDIVAADATLRFAPGETSKPITIQIVGDLLHEDLEAFNVYLDTPSSNAWIAQSAGYCYIEDNDPTPTVSIGDVSKNEGNSGTTKFNFTLTLSAPINNGGYVEFATSNGTATASQDYTAKSGYVYFDLGQTTQTISIDVKGDRTSEANETLFVNLVAAGGATIADGQGVGTIVNDDSGSTSQLPTISIGDASVVEGNSGTKLMSFTVSLSAASSQEVRVNYATANGTAKTSDNDYVSKSGTIIFSPGQTTKTITITVKGDRKVEQDEQFTVKLSGAKNGTIGDGQGAGTILNDDGFTTANKPSGPQKLAASSVDAAIDDWMSFGARTAVDRPN